jgi:hypothetical protein
MLSPAFSCEKNLGRGGDGEKLSEKPEFVIYSRRGVGVARRRAADGI